MLMIYKILDKQHNLIDATVEEWALWAATHWDDRRVAEDTINGIYISTVYTLDSKFETMYAGSIVEHYSSWASAEAGHALWVEKARGET